MKSIQRVFQSLAAGFLAFGTATARADPATGWQVKSLDVRPAANPAFARDVVIHFGGLPWTSYEVEAGDSLNHWTPVGRAAQLPTLSAERDALAAGLPPAQAEAAARQAALGNTPVTDPTDLDDRRVKERFWIDFDSQYLDWKWTDMVTEWQRHKNNFRAILQSLGTSAAEIDKLDRHWKTQEDIRRKWMRIFTGEPINLRLLLVNQFTGFTVDVENAVWEVVYQDKHLNREVRVQVGSGGELTLPPETVAGIWQEAKNREGTGGDTVVVDLRVTYERIHADGTRERGYQDQQVIIVSRSRTEDEAQRAALRDQTPRGVR